MALEITVDSGDGLKNGYWSFNDFSEDIEFRSTANGTEQEREYRHVARVTGSRALYLIDSVVSNANLQPGSAGSLQTEEEGLVSWKAAGYDPFAPSTDGSKYQDIVVVSQRVIRDSDFGGGAYQEVITWEAFTAWAQYEPDQVGA